MQVQQINDWLLHVTAEEGEDLSQLYRLAQITEIVRTNADGSVFTHLRTTRRPVVCPFLDLNFMRVTYRKCHIWFTKEEINSKVKIACGEYPIPVDDDQFTIDDVTYKLTAR